MQIQPPSLKVQIAVALFVTLAITWLAAYLELRHSRSSDLREVEQTAIFQAQAFAENTLSSIKRLDEVLLDLRAYWQGRAEPFAELVKRRQEHLSDIAFQVAVIDVEGYLAYSNLAAPSNRTYLGDREHFQVHKEMGDDSLFISKPVKGKVSGKWSIQFTRPILENGRFNGVLVVSVSPDSFASFNDKLGLGSGASTSMIADSGDILARQPGNENAMGNRVTDVPYLAPDAPLSGTFIRDASVDGGTYIHGFYRLPEYRLNFVIAHPLDQVLVSYREHRRNVLVAAAIVSMVVTGLLLLLWRTLLARAEIARRLRDSEAMLRSAVDAMADAFVIYDRDDCLVYCNEPYRRLHQQSADLLVPGRSFEEIMRLGAECGQYQEASDRVDEWVAEQVATHRNGNADRIQHLDDGRWIRIRERKTPEGYIVGIRGDVSEIYKAKEAAEALSRAKSAFLENMSHELRTPLNGILGFAQLLALDLNDPELKAQATSIADSGNHLLRLIEDVLEMSRLGIGQVGTENVEFLMADLVEAVILPFSEATAVNAIQLDSEIDAALPDRMLGPYSQLVRILHRLLNNAVKFSERGRITLRVLPVGRQDDRIDVRFEVADQGVGISPERLDSIFDAFTQADGSRTRRFGGAGLGLAICKQLVHAVGGEMGVESTVGVGSTFRVVVPLHV